MGWDEINSKIKDKSDSYFVSCTDSDEMDDLVKIIHEQLPELGRNSIEKAIAECCRELSAPRLRNQYLKCLREKLK